MSRVKWIRNAFICNEGKIFEGSVRLEGEYIAEIYAGRLPNDRLPAEEGSEVIAGEGLWLLPGAIDSHVHFRDPGLTHKGDMQSESRAAVAGGITSFMDMPNTLPQTTSLDALAWKAERAAQVSCANYAFFFGATNDNVGLLPRLDASRVPGVKVFLCASTGKMTIDRRETLERILGEAGTIVAVHAEKEDIIRRNAAHYAALYGEGVDMRFHPLIRSEEACYAASSEAAELAHRMGVRLHILHLSTERELALLDDSRPLAEKRLTAEACVHHLWFTDADYAHLGSRIKWNPAIKGEHDRSTLRTAVEKGLIDVIATDHSPHLPAEKTGGALQAASGAPFVQHALPLMLELAAEGVFSVEKVVERMCHAPAILYGIDRRGFIRRGYYADLTLIDPSASCTVTRENLHYKCGWSPLEGLRLRQRVVRTFVNGRTVYGGETPEAFPVAGLPLRFVR
ncbi:MAG: dihydroorotase [Tannerellaceae bacterium]|jgi:dihydroorotase|nr:dihydroorotase [Tannerellaceae bacterium]